MLCACGFLSLKVMTDFYIIRYLCKLQRRCLSCWLFSSVTSVPLFNPCLLSIIGLIILMGFYCDPVFSKWGATVDSNGTSQETFILIRRFTIKSSSRHEKMMQSPFWIVLLIMVWVKCGAQGGGWTCTTLLSCSTKEMIPGFLQNRWHHVRSFLLVAVWDASSLMFWRISCSVQRLKASLHFTLLVLLKDRYDFKFSEVAAQNPCRRWDVCCLGWFFIWFWQLIPLLPSLWRMSRLNISLCEPNWAQMLQRLCSSVSCFKLLWKLIARLVFRDEKCS